MVVVQYESVPTVVRYLVNQPLYLLFRSQRFTYMQQVRTALTEQAGYSLCLTVKECGLGYYYFAKHLSDFLVHNLAEKVEGSIPILPYRLTS